MVIAGRGLGLRADARRRVLQAFCVALLASCAGAAHPPTEEISIDAAAIGRPFPHFWERCFGSGRAILSLRESYRTDLSAMKRATGIRQVRFHAIFHDEVGIYDEDARGQPLYNFSYVDQIYDGLLEQGIRPFVELSFMPRKLASKENLHPFWYKQNTSPPRDWRRWGQLVENFVRHLVDRYGVDEVAEWYFEVWNEPNIDFWSGEPKEASYYRLYDTAARAVKRVNPRLRTGGPATAQAAWVDRFIRHCVERAVPLDFVSTHVYANDTSKDVLGTNEAVSRKDMVFRAVKKVSDQVRASSRPELPIHFTEYNASYMNEVPVTDSPFIGPWLANTIRLCDGLVTSLDYWCFSDVFEEQGVVKRPFYGGYGLLAAGNIPKASFNAFALLHRLGASRLPTDSTDALVTRRDDGSLAIAVWNYAAPEEKGTRREFRLTFRGLESTRAVQVRTIDANHGSPLAAWEAMGRPAFPTREQQRELRAAARTPEPRVRKLGPGRELRLTLEPHALALVEIDR